MTKWLDGDVNSSIVSIVTSYPPDKKCWGVPVTKTKDLAIMGKYDGTITGGENCEITPESQE